MTLRNILLLALAATLTAVAQNARRATGGMAVETATGHLVEVRLYDDRIARVIKYEGSTATDLGQSVAVIMKPEEVKFQYEEKNTEAAIRTSKMCVTVDKSSGIVSFYDSKGNPMVTEDSAAIFNPITTGIDKGYCSIAQGWKMDADETIYGLGNLENGHISQRNVNRTLQPGNVEDGIPFFLSIKGYGIYWDNYSPTDIKDVADVITFSSPVAKAVDYYYLQGDDADGVIAAVRTLSGRVPMMPLWTYGFWQSRERYKSQDEILEVATRYRQDSVPIDGMIQDWQYWGNNYLWNAMEFMNPDFSRPQQMVDSLHTLNTHMIISIWSSFGPQTKPYHQMDSIEALFDFHTWPQSGIAEQWPPRMDYPSGVRVYDTYNPAAREIYWNNLKRLYDFGIDGWWMDSTEPDHLDFKPEDLDTPTAMGSFRKMRGAYPILTVGGVHDHQKAENTDKRVFILTRSGWLGQQRYGCNVWTGDVTSTWDNLRKQLGALLNFSLTGNPNTNSDIGGFFAGAYNKSWNDGTATQNPAYRELYTRWMQLGAFTPMMRSHGTDVPREIYYYGKPGEPAYDALAGAIKLRYKLLPYIYSTSWDVTNNHGTFMRALPMDFANDKNVWDNSDAYMFGRGLFVAPITTAQYTPEIIKKTKTDEDGWTQNTGNTSVTGISGVDFTEPKQIELYLPEGTGWWDFFSGEHHNGGKTINMSTTLATIPLFARDGAIIPLGPDVQYASEKPWDDLEIRVFPGADGTFTLYEDEGDNYNYESGAYTEIPMTWNERNRQFTLGARKGQYPGMLENRKFRITLPDGTIRTVDYQGKKMTVKF